MSARTSLQFSPGAAGPVLGHDVIVPLASGGFRLWPADVEMGWQDRALCAQTDPEAFFPEKGGSTREAKKVCRACDVRAECLEYALETGQRYGIWGGLSERERRRMGPARPPVLPSPAAVARKRCPACQTVKDADGFHRNRSRPDGLADHCKACRTSGGTAVAA